MRRLVSRVSAKLRFHLSQDRIVSRLSRLALRSWYRDRPAPIGRLLPFKRAIGRDDGILSLSQDASTGRRLANPRLAARFPTTEMGSWTVHPDALNFLERQVRKHKPGLVLELGCGISTVCLAQYMAELHGHDGSVRVYSVDQDPAFAESCRHMLKEMKLELYARVFVAPLVELEIAGVRTRCYELPRELDGVRADLLLVDGPAGESGIRFGTLPMALPLMAPDATLFLDDALRDAELDIAASWSKLPKVHISGIVLYGHGLLAGRVSGSEWPG